MAAPCTSITDERLAVLLEEIFLRLPTPADLIRAFVAFHQLDSVRQLLADRSFLRRFRKQHSPSFIGFMDWHGLRHVHPPHTSAPIAGAIVGAADFTFSFLPGHHSYSFSAKPGCWCVRSIRDGRFLLDRGELHQHSLVFPELVVCDPLHRRYRLLPPIPDDLAASVRDPLEVSRNRSCEVILVPPGKEVDEEEEDTSFRVVWMAHCKTKPVAFVYSSSTGQWEAVASEGWSNLLGCVPPVSLEYNLFDTCAHAYGCLYWPMNGPECGLQNYPREVMLVLDTMRMEFSVADLPPGRRWRGLRVGIVEAGEGRLGIAVISFSEVGEELHYIVRKNTDESSNKWHLEKIIPLGLGLQHEHLIMEAAFVFSHINGTTERCLLIRRSDVRMEHGECFSLDLNTFQLERVGEIPDVEIRPIYISFPPSLSSRTV